MKLIKLNGRYNLYHKGYRFAFRFNGWTAQATDVERAVKKLEGYHYDSIFWSKTYSSNGTRPFYVGVRNESTATMVSLML